MSDFTQVKSVLASRTVWGAAVAVLASLAGLLGLTVTADDQTKALDLADQLLSEWDRLAAIAGAALAIYGRIRASKRIGR